MSREKYESDALPTQITTTVYVCYAIGDYFAGEISVKDYSPSSDYIILATHEITLGIPEQDRKEIKGKVLAVLQEQLSTIRADNFMKEKVVLDKIENLLAIESKVAGE